MITKIPNESIVAALPHAREIVKPAQAFLDGVKEGCGYITFEDVRDAARRVSNETFGPCLFQAVVRVLECQNTITLEVK